MNTNLEEQGSSQISYVRKNRKYVFVPFVGLLVLHFRFACEILMKNGPYRRYTRMKRIAINRRFVALNTLLLIFLLMIFLPVLKNSFHWSNKVYVVLNVLALLVIHVCHAVSLFYMDRLFSGDVTGK